MLVRGIWTGKGEEEGRGRTVAEMHACISETDAGKGGSEEHLALGFMVFWIFGCAGEVLDGASKCLQGKDIADGVCALVGRSIDRIRWAGNAFKVRYRSPALETVAQNIETRASVHSSRHGAGVEWITYPKRGLEISMRDSCLGPFGDKIENRGPRGFGSGSCCGGNGDKRLQRLRYWEAFS